MINLFDIESQNSSYYGVSFKNKRSKELKDSNEKIPENDNKNKEKILNKIKPSKFVFKDEIG